MEQEICPKCEKVVYDAEGFPAGRQSPIYISFGIFHSIWPLWSRMKPFRSGKKKKTHSKSYILIGQWNRNRKQKTLRKTSTLETTISCQVYCNVLSKIIKIIDKTKRKIDYYNWKGLFLKNWACWKIWSN